MLVAGESPRLSSEELSESQPLPIQTEVKLVPGGTAERQQRCVAKVSAWSLRRPEPQQLSSSRSLRKYRFFCPPVSAAAHTGLEARPALCPPQGRPGRTQRPNQTTHNTCSFQGSNCLSQLSETTVPTLEPSSFLLALKAVAALSQLDGPPSLDIRSELRSGMNIRVVHGPIPPVAE